MREVLWLLAVCMLGVLTTVIQASLYDPHLYPTSGPFFEGWYIRAVDHDVQLSFAVLFGKVLPSDPSVVLVRAYLGLLFYDVGEDTPRLFFYDDLPEPSVVSVTVKDGEPVTSDPAVEGSAYFRWSAGDAGYVEVLPDKAVVNVTVEGVRVEAEVGPPQSWDEGREGPEGWLRHIPFIPLDWFIYSTHSPLISYSLTFPHSRRHVKGHSGLVHMEKNWGKSFPDAWVWTQGMRKDNVTFAATYGPVDFGPVTLPGHLGGYRNPHQRLAIDFRPDNSYMVVTEDPCRADLLLTIYTYRHKLIIHVFAPYKSFSDCILGPTENGFTEIAHESFQATAEILVFERSYLTFEEIDSQVIPLSALEFGGAYTCHSECTDS